MPNKKTHQHHLIGISVGVYGILPMKYAHRWLYIVNGISYKKNSNSLELFKGVSSSIIYLIYLKSNK